jgi:hypothetical protein
MSNLVGFKFFVWLIVIIEHSIYFSNKNVGGSIALETPGAHKIGDWRLGC